MKRGRHATDGSMQRSVGGNTGRGLVLVAVAFVIGLFLLNRVDEPAPADQVETAASEEDDTTTTTAAPTVTTSTAPLRQPKDIRVLSANGTNVKGAGGRIKDRVLAAGYNALAATDTKTPANASAVYYTPGFEREAAALAQLLSLQPAAVQAMPNPAPVADLKAANILVVVGPDLAQAGTTSSSTSTTARSNTTTTARAGTTTSTTR